jgi:predicted lipoprotein with Yx(FWY)xxD motif
MARRSLVAIALAGLILASMASLALAQDMGGLSTSVHPSLGPIVTDANGMTVYTWAGDTQGAGSSACSGNCAVAWPPVPADDTMAMDMMGMATGVGALQRDDGSYQLTLNGWPLYRFANDRAPGDANGNGSNGFGARWSVVPADQLMGM